MTLLQVFGLCVDSDVPFAAPAAAAAARADVVIRAGEHRVIESDMPAGETLSEVRTDGGALWSATVATDDHTVVLRLPRTAEFVLRPDRIEWHRDPGIEPDFISVLLPGMCLATYLQWRGNQILHASAVHMPDLDGVVAFVGASGMGKSTMAALLAASGGNLFADDIVRFEHHASVVVAHRGTLEARLRPAAASLAGSLPAHETSDGRTAVAFSASKLASAPLRALVFPGPDRKIDTLHLERLTGGPALFRLLQNPRLLNWVDPQHTQRQFDALASLVDTVPVYSSRIPWGPPFPANLANQFVEQLLERL